MSMHEEHLSPVEYAKLSKLIYDVVGIQLGPDRKTMLGARIHRRLKALDLANYADYCSYLFGIHGQREEIVHLIDVVTTNKTDFFREPAHFTYLIQKALPEMIAHNESGRPLLIWSAGCSTGEEPYTLAMLLSDYAEQHPGFQFRLLATDISTSVLAKAKKAVFTSQVAAPIPANLRKKYLMRSRNRESDLVRIVPELRRLVEFRRLNFMDADYAVKEQAAAIFCRNVLIYFDRQTQERILAQLTNHLTPRGYLFVGHSESLHDMRLPLASVAPALYRKVSSHG
jgi:chemotaxis protein methyltransferase CheR